MGSSFRFRVAGHRAPAPSLVWIVLGLAPPMHARGGGQPMSPLTPGGGEPSPPPKFNSLYHYFINLHINISFISISNSSFMGAGPLDPPSLRGGPAGNDLALLSWCQWDVFSCGVGPPDPPWSRLGAGQLTPVCPVSMWRGSPGPPLVPVRGRAVNTCLPCSCQWDDFLLVAWVLRTPQPRWGPAVSDLALPLM